MQQPHVGGMWGPLACLDQLLPEHPTCDFVRGTLRVCPFADEEACLCSKEQLCSVWTSLIVHVTTEVPKPQTIKFSVLSLPATAA